MVTLKEFIKENSTTETSKKKRRIKLKNLNPFRNRKYKTLNDDLQKADFDPNPQISLPCDIDQNSSPCSTNEKGAWAAAAKRQLPKELLQSARGRLGLSKVNQDDPYPRKRVCKEGSSECLIDTVEAELTPGDDVATDPTAGSLSDSDDEETSQKESVMTKRPSIKKVVISEEIEIIETEIEEEIKKKKKSKKKKIKKAGKKAIEFLGHGLTNMAMSLRYLTPDAAMAPALSEIARQREQRYRELSAAMAYSMS